MTWLYCKISCFPEPGLGFCDGIGPWSIFFFLNEYIKIDKKKKN